MSNIKEKAEVFRLGLIIGIFEVKEVVAWADEVIAAEADPEFAIIDVSMAGDASNGTMASHLSKVSGDADSQKVFGALCGILSKRANTTSSLSEVCGQLTALERGEGANFPKELSALLTTFRGAEASGEGLGEAARELGTYLARYES